MDGGFRRSARIRARRTSLQSAPTRNKGTETPKTMPPRKSAGREWRETLAASKLSGVQHMGVFQPPSSPWDWNTLLTWAFRILPPFVVLCTCVAFFSTRSLRPPSPAVPEIDKLSLFNISKDMIDLQQGFQKILEYSPVNLGPRIAKTLSKDTLHISGHDIKRNGPLEDFRDTYLILRDRLDETLENLEELEDKILSDLSGISSTANYTLRGVETARQTGNEKLNRFQRYLYSMFSSTPAQLCQEYANQVNEIVWDRFSLLNSTLESLEGCLIASEAIGRIHKAGLKLSQEYWEPSAAEARRESFRKVFKDKGDSVKVIQDAFRRVKREKDAVEKVGEELHVLKGRFRDIIWNEQELGDVVDLLESSLRDLEPVIKRARKKAPMRKPWAGKLWAEKVSARGHVNYKDLVDSTVQWARASFWRLRGIGPWKKEEKFEKLRVEKEERERARREKEKKFEQSRVEREERERARREKEEKFEKLRVEREERERAWREKEKREKEKRERQEQEREDEMQLRRHVAMVDEFVAQKLREAEELNKPWQQKLRSRLLGKEAQEKKETDLNRYMVAAIVWCLFWAWLGF